MSKLRGERLELRFDISQCTVAVHSFRECVKHGGVLGQAWNWTVQRSPHYALTDWKAHGKAVGSRFAVLFNRISPFHSLNPRTESSPFGTGCSKLLRGYVQGREEDATVFDLSTDRVRAIVRALSKRAGCKALYSPHDLRHFFAIQALRGGASLESVRRLLGHSSLNLTQIYLDYGEEVVAEDYRRAFEAQAKADGGGDG